MKTCTKCGETKPLSEFHKQKLGKHGVEACCKACRAINDRARKVRDRDKINAWKRAHYYRNRDRLLPETRERSARWYAKNRERKASTAKEYAKTNRPLLNEVAAKRRAAERQAAPTWADRKLMRFFYATRDYLVQETGEQWHVDHVVPLQGRNVCGLHVHNNLRVIPAAVNLSKSNKFPTD